MAAKRNKNPKPANWIEEALAAAAKVTDKTDADKRVISGATTLAQAGTGWRYMDFLDVRTGWPVLPMEFLFGARGLVTGRMYFVNASSSVGKSSLCYALYGMGQVGCDAMPIHCESEHAPHPPHYVASYGCNPKTVMYLRPSSMKNAFADAMSAVRHIRSSPSGEITGDGYAPIITGYDSISNFGGAELKENEAAGEASDASLGAQAREVAKFFREGGSEQLDRDKAIAICVAQTKAKLMTNVPGYMQKNMPQKDKETTLAENALLFAASTRIRLTGKELKEGEKSERRVIGTEVTMTSVKNKVNESDKTITVALVRNQGFDFAGASYDFIVRNLGEKEGTPLTHGEHAGQTFGVSLAGGRINCPLVLGSSTLPTDGDGPLDFVSKFYENEALLMSVRETLRIMGFGFKFETDYEVIAGAPDVAKQVPS